MYFRTEAEQGSKERLLESTFRTRKRSKCASSLYSSLSLYWSPPLSLLPPLNQRSGNNNVYKKREIHVYKNISSQSSPKESCDIYSGIQSGHGIWEKTICVMNSDCREQAAWRLDVHALVTIHFPGALYLRRNFWCWFWLQL